jgi:hypothetical protein
MPQQLDSLVDTSVHRLGAADFRAQCKQTLDDDGVLVLRGFLGAHALDSIRQEGLQRSGAAFYANTKHNVYLRPQDDALPSDHARNRLVVSSKGCITDEDIPPDSPLRTLYNAPLFRDFVGAVLGEAQVYPYADKLSSINLHYAHTGQELGWHFDNSSFAITLLIQKPQAGGVFEYISHLRDADRGDMNYSGVASALDGQMAVRQLAMEPGDLVLFRGRNAMHRVTPTEGPVMRMLVVLAYNSQPGVALSESARMTFYGRL